MIDIVEVGLDTTKSVMIVTERGQELADMIYQRLGRTVTFIEGKARRGTPAQAELGNIRKAMILVVEHNMQILDILDSVTVISFGEKIFEGTPEGMRRGHRHVFWRCGMSNNLEVRGLKVMYGKSVAIHDIHITVPEGGIVTLIGSNGAGKSTTLNACLATVPATEGTITFDGADITHASTAERVRRSLVLGRHLFPYLTVQKNLLLGATQRSDKEGIQKDMEFCFELFPILKDRLKQKAGTMSGGQQQMLAIARGIMANPKLLCLDEPSLGLAPAVIDDIGHKIKEINQSKGTSILLVEHNMQILDILDSVTVISFGEKIFEGTPEGMRQKAYFGG